MTTIMEVEPFTDHLDFENQPDDNQSETIATATAQVAATQYATQHADEQAVLSQPTDAVTRHRYHLEQAATIKAEAINELLNRRIVSSNAFDETLKRVNGQYKRELQTIDSELSALGYIPETSVSPAAAPAVKRTRAKRTDKPATAKAKVPHCKHCDIDGHDARHHIGQLRAGKKVKAFSTAELKRLGL